MGQQVSKSVIPTDILHEQGCFNMLFKAHVEIKLVIHTDDTHFSTAGHSDPPPTQTPPPSARSLLFYY